MSTLEVNSVTGYQGGPVAFPDGLTVDGAPVVNEATQAAALAVNDAQQAVFRGQAAEGVGNYLDVLPEPYVLANAAIQGVMLSGVGRVGLFGHSIAEGADITAANHYFTTFASMLRAKFPNVNWSFHNRGLAGKTSGQLTSPSFVGGVSDAGSTYFRPANANPEVWPDGSTMGRSYLNEIELLELDVLLVHAWQNDTDVRVSIASLIALEAEVATWAKVPQLVLCTEYLPASSPDGQYGADEASQNGMQAIADGIRSYAMKKGHFLIDFNAAYRLNRDGVKVEHGRFVREWRLFNFDGGASSPNWLSAGVSVTGQTASFAAGGGVLIRRVRTRDLEQKGILANLAASDVVKLSWGRVNAQNENEGGVLQLRPGSGVTQVDLYSRGDLITTNEMAFAHGSGGKLQFQVRIVSGRIEAYFRPNDNEWVGPLQINLPETNASAAQYAGYFGLAVDSPSNTGGQILFEYEANYVPTNGKFRVGAAMPPLFTMGDLMGAVPYPGDMNTNPVSLGGNAINHVGSVGSHLYMIPAVARFVRHFARVWELTKTYLPESPVNFPSELKLMNGGTLTSFSPPQMFPLYYTKRGTSVTINGAYGNPGADLAVPSGQTLVFTLPVQAAFTDGTRLAVQPLFSAEPLGLLPVAATGSEVLGSLSVRIPGATSYAIVRAMSLPTGTFKEMATVKAGATVSFGGTYISAT